MKAVVIHQNGGLEALRYEDAADPTPGANEVLIEVRAASINHVDLWIRKGIPGKRFAFPLIPGCDAAGIIRAVGEGVSGLAAGTRVTINPGISCGHCEFCAAGYGSQCNTFTMIGEERNGSYAQLLKVPAHIVLPIPDTLSFEDAAAAPLVTLTAWSMMVNKGKLQPGEDVLILAVGAGVGTAALQIAKMMGCRVFAAASTDAKLERAKQLGADFLINYAKEDFDKKIRDLTNKRGVDVVVDYVGGDSWVKSLRSARKGGRVLTCGATAGFDPKTDLRHVFYRQVQVIGSTMGSHRDFLDAMRCVFRGEIRPVIDRVLPLSEAQRGHEAIERREVFGKVVLRPEDYS
jgi:NADPH:quinone reductase-like Zn-dependent oxidoreductase